MKLILNRLIQSDSLVTGKTDVDILERSFQIEHKKQVPIDMFLYFQPA